jgi:ABC-type transport system involved in multi-copper enzyme maturation permease subunit
MTMRKTKSPDGGAYYLRSLRDVFQFFFVLGKRARKTKVFYLISFIPVVIAFVIKFYQIFSGQSRFEDIYIFTNIIMVFYLQFLVLILALFFGTSVVSEELEGKTLTYLTTRPLPKSSLILGKYAAYTLLAVLMTAVSVVIAFLILNLRGLLDLSLYKLLFKDLAVLALGVMCYTAFFTLIGTFMKRSIMFGLIFCFGWETVIQYFPGSTQRFAIAHYLKSLLPAQNSGRFSFLMFRLEPTSPAMAVLMLLLLTAAFLLIACLVFSLKEYVLDE